MNNITSLYDILENLTNLHRALYTLAAEKKNALIEGDMNALTRITQQEQKIVKAIDAAEASRIELVKEIYAERNLPFIEGTLAELIKSLTGVEEKAKLTSYREELIRIVSELRSANELNQQLLDQSLSFVNMSLDLLTDSPEDDFIYRKPTGSQQNSHRTFINKKA